MEGPRGNPRKFRYNPQSYRMRIRIIQSLPVIDLSYLRGVVIYITTELFGLLETSLNVLKIASQEKW